MLRDLSYVLAELQTALIDAATDPRLKIQIVSAEMLLPIDIRLVFQHGGAVMQGDVQRASKDANWNKDVSRLRIGWQQIPTEQMPLEPELVAEANPDLEPNPDSVERVS